MSHIPRPALPGISNAVVMELSDGRSVYTGVDGSTVNGLFSLAVLNKDMTAYLSRDFQTVLAAVVGPFQFRGEQALLYSSPVNDGTSVWLVGPYALYRYDVDSPGTVVEVQDLPVHNNAVAAPHNRERRAPAVAVSGGKLFVAGGSSTTSDQVTSGNGKNAVTYTGYNQGTQMVSSVVYCTLDGSGGCGAWSTLASSLSGDGRAFMSYCASGTKLYLVGGRTASWQYRVIQGQDTSADPFNDAAVPGGQVGTVEVIDMAGLTIDTSYGSLPVSLEWGDYGSDGANLGTIGTGSRSHCAIKSSTLYVAGGGNSAGVSEKVYAMDLDASSSNYKTFYEVAGVTLPAAEYGFRATAHVTNAAGGKLLIYSSGASTAAASLDVSVAA